MWERVNFGHEMVYQQADQARAEAANEESQ